MLHSFPRHIFALRAFFSLLFFFTLPQLSFVLCPLTRSDVALPHTHAPLLFFVVAVVSLFIFFFTNTCLSVTITISALGAFWMRVRAVLVHMFPLSMIYLSFSAPYRRKSETKQFL